MKKTYEKLLELLNSVPAIRYVDLDSGQLLEDQPPVSYPCVLVRISESCSDMQEVLQRVDVSITLTVVDKLLSETHQIARKSIREKGLKYMQLQEDIFSALQGQKDDHFDAFTNRSTTDVQIRKGLKTVQQVWETSYYREV